MRHAYVLAAALALPALAPSLARAQQVDLPRPSPSARVMQTVGLTDVTVDYSSPAVNKRTIWGGLVPYDKVWRTGANSVTKITFSKDVTVGGKAVPAGTYALMTIPSAKGWTLIINKDANQWGAFTYDEKQDLVRVPMQVGAAPMRERMTFLFDDTTSDKTTLALEWEKLRATVPIVANTTAQADEAVKQLEQTGWRVYTVAARYELDKKDYDAGLRLVDKSIALKEDWFNLWTKAQLLAGKGDRKEALALAEKADAIGSKLPGPMYFFAADVKKALKEWKK